MYTLNLDSPGHLLRPLSPSSSLAALSKDEKICDDDIYVTKIMSFQIQGPSNIFKYNNKNLASCPSHHPSNLALALKAELSLSILRTSTHFVLQFSCFKSFASVFNQLFHSQEFLIVWRDTEIGYSRNLLATEETFTFSDTEEGYCSGTEEG